MVVKSRTRHDCLHPRTGIMAHEQSDILRASTVHRQRVYSGADYASSADSTEITAPPGSPGVREQAEKGGTISPRCPRGRVHNLAVGVPLHCPHAETNVAQLPLPRARRIHWHGCAPKGQPMRAAMPGGRVAEILPEK